MVFQQRTGILIQCMFVWWRDHFPTQSYRRTIGSKYSWIRISISHFHEIWIFMPKVVWPLGDSWQNSSLQIFICFHHFFVPFRGFEPHPRRFFFMKSDIKWAFFTYSNTLEIHVINLWEICTRNEQNRDRDLFMYYIHFK